MGYFNYFIKCIIRNISYKLCKPKVFLTVLLSICVLFGLKHYGFCALADSDYEMIADGFATITQNQSVTIDLLSNVGVNVTTLKNTLNSINTTINSIKTDTNLTVEKLNSLINEVDSLNTTLSQLAQQQNVYYQNMSSEIRTIRDALVGSDDTPITPQYIGVVNATHSGGYTPGLCKIKIPMIKSYTYDIDITYTNNTSSAFSVSYMFSSVDVASGGTIGDATLTRLGIVPANSSITFTVSTRDYKKPFLYTTYGYNVSGVSGTSSIEGIVDILDRTNQDVVNNIQQGNQLQEEQNQLQQEQNDFLKQETTDNDVSVDNFNSVDANDITSSGLTGIFTTIYNSINSWSSKDIVLPVPFTNKSLTIPANYTNNMLSSVGGGLLITIVSTVYYFIVARFIIYTITGIINSIKSGSILDTDTKNNITTEML